MNIYQLDAEYKSVLKELAIYSEENEGELPDDLCDILDGIEVERNRKIGNLIRYYKNLVVQQKAVESEIKKVKSFFDRKKKHVDRLKEFLSTIISVDEKYKDEISSTFWKNTVSTEVEDENLLPEEYQNVKITANKTEIKKALQSGKEIEGCSLKKNRSLVIR